jgi:hypothetical protein
MGGDTRAEAGAAAGEVSVASGFSMCAGRSGEGGLAGAGIGASVTTRFAGGVGAGDEVVAPSIDRDAADDGCDPASTDASGVGWTDAEVNAGVVVAAGLPVSIGSAAAALTLAGISAVVRSDGPALAVTGVATFRGDGSTPVAVAGDAACCGMGGRLGRLNAAVFVLAVVEVAGLLMGEPAAVDASADTGLPAKSSFGARVVAAAAAVAGFSFDSGAGAPACTDSPDAAREARAAGSTGADDDLALLAAFSTLSRSSSSSAWAEAASDVPVSLASSSCRRRRRPPRRPRRRRDAPPSASPFSSAGASPTANATDSAAGTASTAAVLAASSSGSPVGRSAGSARGGCSALACGDFRSGRGAACSLAGDVLGWRSARAVCV